MTGYALPLDAVSGSPAFTAQETRMAWSVLAGAAPVGRPLGAVSGVRAGTPSTTVSLSGTGSMTWNCAAFSAILDVESAANAGPYFVAFDGTDTGSVAAQDPTNPRVDIIYVQLNDDVQDGSGLRNTSLNYLAGTPAATPSAPAPPNSRTLVIANLNVPKSGGGVPSASWVAPVAGAPDSANVSQVGTMQTIPNGAYTAMRLDSAGVNVNQGGMYNPAQTDRLTAKKPGTFRLIANASLTSNATGTRRLIFEVNGSVLCYGDIRNAVSGTQTSMTITAETHLNPGDYAQAMIFQDSGGSLQLVGTTSFSMTYVNGN